jgi:hypothetical protein
MGGADRTDEKLVPANLEELHAQVAAAWRALVEAAFGLTNAVNAAASAEDTWAAEQTLGRAARAYAAATTALVDAAIPKSSRRARRR